VPIHWSCLKKKRGGEYPIVGTEAAIVVKPRAVAVKTTATCAEAARNVRRLIALINNHGDAYR
jgi:hypothetical protein